MSCVFCVAILIEQASFSLRRNIDGIALVWRKRNLSLLQYRTDLSRYRIYFFPSLDQHVFGLLSIQFNRAQAILRGTHKSVLNWKQSHFPARAPRHHFSWRRPQCSTAVGGGLGGHSCKRGLGNKKGSDRPSR